jgi:hypothetical protein
MMELKEREQVVKDLQEIVDNYSGSWKRFNVLDGALALIKELVEENEKFRHNHEKLIEERDTFREYAYNMQKYVENIRHKEEEGYEPSAARYAAEMDMWRVVTLEKKKLTDENERLNERLDREAKCQYDLATKIVNLRDDVKYIKAETVRKMQKRLTSDEFYIVADDYDGMQYVDFCAWVEEIASEILGEE